jgi:curli biogenesis system outer membrane secretion channel CsgG
VAVAVLALNANGCSKAPAPVTAAPTATLPPACAKLQARIAHCAANVKQGKFEFQFDPTATQEPALCEQADRMLDSIAQTTGCES